jgi:preprotein translocase subunit SecF
MFEFVPKGFYYDFVAKRHFWAYTSLILSGVALVLFSVVGPHWSIDFTGGTEIEMHFAKPVAIAEVRAALEPAGVGEDAVQQVGDPAENQFALRMQGDTAAKQSDLDAVRAALEASHGKDWIESFEVENEVGARVSLAYTGPPVTPEQIARELGAIEGVSVQGGTDENSVYVRLPGVSESVKAALERAMPENVLTIDRADSVGPKVGDSLRMAGLTALIVSTILHLIYIAIRFDLSFAPGATVCLVHDVIITCGILVVLRQEFGLSTLSALLTLSGYSLNDTIIVYDRIRENGERYRKKDFGTLINDSINQTLSRTIMTAGATSLAMVPFLFIGGAMLQQFALVMLIGIVIGTYSSVYVAAPITLTLRHYEPAVRRLLGLGEGAVDRRVEPQRPERPQ